MDYYDKYLKYKQKYIALRAQSNFSQSDSFKQKYIALKAQSNLNKFGGALCIVCNKDKPLQDCSGCNFMKYCSTDCQRADWPRHKTKCKEIKDLLTKVNIRNSEELASFRGVRDRKKSIFEITTRSVAVRIITDFYEVLNRKCNFPPENYDYFKYIFPGWYRFPLNPNIPSICGDDDKSIYKELRLKPIPLLNTRLDLNFSSVPEGNTLKMECTSAFYMTQFAIIQRLIPRMTAKILDLRVIDQIIAKNPENYPNEYNQEVEIATLRSYISAGFLTPDYFDNIHRKS